jgi:hypothetical protein
MLYSPHAKKPRPCPMCEAGIPVVKKYYVWDDINKQYLILSEKTYNKIQKALKEKFNAK